MKYNKPAHSIPDQIELLKGRGLLISDTDEAEYYLGNISYYRLAGYWWSMQSDKNNHVFKPKSTFQNVIAIYNFDRELRMLIFNAIERIEIALRTKLIYHLSHEADPWWFENPDLFMYQDTFEQNIKVIDRELKNTKEIFIFEHRNKYKGDTRRPPAWKTLEVVSFGTLSRIYGNLKGSVKSKNLIAVEFGTANYTYLHSWLQVITQIRNLCAHHSRLWNKTFSFAPKLMSKPPKNWLLEVPSSTEDVRIYLQVCCIKYLLQSVDKVNDVSQQIQHLFDKYPNIDSKAMGFPVNWSSQPLWKN